MLKGATLSKAFRKHSSPSELTGEGEGNICAILLWSISSFSFNLQINFREVNLSSYLLEVQNIFVLLNGSSIRGVIIVNN